MVLCSIIYYFFIYCSPFFPQKRGCENEERVGVLLSFVCLLIYLGSPPLIALRKLLVVPFGLLVERNALFF